MGKVEEKVACQYCGKEYSKAGIANHEKSCAENPKNKKEDVKEIELFDIKMKDSIECYIGDQYYRLKAGETYKVPANVKEILKRAGLLDAI